MKGLRAAGAGIALLLTFSACGDAEEQSLCTVFAAYLAAEQRINAIDPTTASAGDISDAVDEGLARVRHLRQVADDRYVDQILLLEIALDDVRRTLDTVDDDADYSIWQPLVEDSVEDARNAADVVSTLIAPSCLPGS